MSVLAESSSTKLSKSSFSKRPLLWCAVLAAAVLIAIVALILAQPGPTAIDYLAGIAIPL